MREAKNTSQIKASINNQNIKTEYDIENQKELEKIKQEEIDEETLRKLIE